MPLAMPLLKRALLAAGLLAGGLALGPSAARAAVVVLANRTTSTVEVVIDHAGEQKYRIESGDLVAVPVTFEAQTKIAFESEGNPLSYQLEPNSAYYFFTTRLEGLGLEQIGFTHDSQVTELRALMQKNAAATDQRKLPAIARIPVKVLVDDEERLVRKGWEDRLRERMERASDIFEKHCGIRFKIVAFDTWDSDDKITEFARTLVELEREVPPAPARLVIGFTSQYEPIEGQATKLGGTRAAFYPYILVREWSRYYTEQERLEVLVHELGHYLGAVHSPEPDSVMRPRLGDRRARLKSFRIGFDPANTLAMYLIGEEYRARGNIRRLVELSPATRLELLSIYNEVAHTLPDDPAARQYIGLLGTIPVPLPQVRLRPSGVGATAIEGAPANSAPRPRGNPPGAR